jgi:hypothetical protein
VFSSDALFRLCACTVLLSLLFFASQDLFLLFVCTDGVLLYLV